MAARAAEPAPTPVELKLLERLEGLTAEAQVTRFWLELDGTPNSPSRLDIARYPKQIQAIEVWNEPNLMREWGDVIDGGAYAQMLAAAYGVIKYLDPNIMVISAGLAPTGFNDEWEAVDDAPFLRGFFEYQGNQYADCLGTHANRTDGIGDIHVVAHARPSARVLVDGLRWARGSGFARLVILWNLNFNGSHDDPNAPYALVRPQGTSPAVDAIAREMRAP